MQDFNQLANHQVLIRIHQLQTSEDNEDDLDATIEEIDSEDEVRYQLTGMGPGGDAAEE